MEALKKYQDYITPAMYQAHYANDPEEKWELIDGEVYAMAGASSNHVTIALNLATTLKLHLRGKPCKTYLSDLRVDVADNYYYPDVLVDCGDVHKNRLSADKPLLIIEVISKSTAFLDRTKKLLDYQMLSTLQEYIVVEQDKMKVTVYRRREQWAGEVYLQGDVPLSSLDLVVPMADIYEDIVFTGLHKRDEQ